MRRFVPILLATASLSACTLIPHYERPRLPVPDRWPSDAKAETAAERGPNPADLSAAEIGWRSFFADPRLRSLIAIALENNRNLRVAVLNVEASQAQFQVQRGALFPGISATGSEIAEKLPPAGAAQLGGVAGAAMPVGGSGFTFHTFSAGIGFTNYELDLFGRERSLTREAFEQYLSQSETQRSAHISLVAEVATDYFAVLADQALLKLTEETLANRRESYEVTRAMFERGTTTLLSLRQAETTVDSARASLAQYQRQLAQDSHALDLVVGEPIPADLPVGANLDGEHLLAALPAGLPSDLLTRRPDIMAAEHSLRAANANIGAARAAFLPSISLTGSGGSESSTLQGLFKPGTAAWSFAPTVTLPLFTGGENRANLKLAHIQRQIAVANYELAIQTAFREVSDALSARDTYTAQLQAQRALVAADADDYRLSDMRFRAGIDNFLNTLDAQRSLYTDQQTLVSLRQGELTNLVTLYKALGGGWVQYSSG